MTILETLYNWVKIQNGIEVIYAYQNAPALENLYATLEIVNDSSTSFAQIESNDLQIDKTVDISIRINFETFVSINIFGTEAYEKALQLKQSLYSQATTDLFNENNIGFVRTSDIRKLNEIIRQQYEPRSQFDLFLNTRQIAIENIETIQKFELTNSITQETRILERT